MNPDQKLIESAYEDVLRKLYWSLFDNYTQSGGDPAEQARADQTFIAGVLLARTSRDRAIALLA